MIPPIFRSARMLPLLTVSYCFSGCNKRILFLLMGLKRGKKDRGAPPKYSKRMVELASTLSFAGHAPKDIIKYLGIGSTTYYRWIKEHKEFRDALKKAAKDLEIDLLTAMKKEAIGYTVTEERVKTSIVVIDGNEVEQVETTITTKHLRSNFVAAKFLLTNINGNKWRNNNDNFNESIVQNDRVPIVLDFGDTSNVKLPENEDEIKDIDLDDPSLLENY